MQLLKNVSIYINRWRHLPGLWIDASIPKLTMGLKTSCLLLSFLVWQSSAQDQTGTLMKPTLLTECIRLLSILIFEAAHNSSHDFTKRGSRKFQL
jgi:hypothetical protein